LLSGIIISLLLFLDAFLKLKGNSLSKMFFDLISRLTLSLL